MFPNPFGCVNMGSVINMPVATRSSPKLFSDFNTLQFAGVMAMVVFVMLLPFMMITTPHHGVSVDLPKAWHPAAMSGALREDAMKIWILRDGKVFFGNEQISADSLPARITDHLKNRGVERKVYIAADARARWGTVKEVLDGVRAAGILRVAFLAHQRINPNFPR